MWLFAVADVGGPQSFHIGDEAMLKANLTKLGQLAPEVGSTVPSGEPEWTSRHYAVQAVQSSGALAWSLGDTLSGNRYPIVFGDYSDLEFTMPFVGALQEENRHLCQAAGEAERFAKSLLEENQLREETRREAEKDAKSFEAELSRLRKSRTPAKAS